MVIPYSGKFWWGPIFAEGQSSKFLWFNFHGCMKSWYIHCTCVIEPYFVGLIFADNSLSIISNFPLIQYYIVNVS